MPSICNATIYACGMPKRIKPMLLLAGTTVVDPDPLFILPFAALLLAIALLPVFLKHHWERHYHTISAGLGSIAVFYYGFGLKAWAGCCMLQANTPVSWLSSARSLSFPAASTSE